MNAAKTKKTSGSRRSPKPPSPLQGVWRRVFIGLAFAALAGGGSLFAWRKFGDGITQKPEYFVQADSIEIATPTPPWIRTDVRSEVVRDGSLAELPILDRQLTVKVAQAFAMHCWVENVKHVSKHPQGRVVIDLEYRKPVAMVEVVVDGQPGLLPVDGNGVLLSPADFTPEDSADYLRISVPDSRPLGALGEGWGDPRIHGAACLAALLQPKWKELGLYRVALSEVADAQGPVLEVQTRRGVRVLWGLAPDPEDAAQIQLAASKVQRLVERVDAQGPLDEMEGTPAIDLRTPNESGQPALRPDDGRWE